MNALTPYLYEALASPTGLFIRTHDPLRLKTALYNARAIMRDPQLATLTIRTAPPPYSDELWVLPRDPEPAP